MVENGPRTHELVEEFEKMREFMREDRHEVNRRITTLESSMKIVAVVGGAALTGLVTFLVLVLIGVVA